MRSIPPGDGLLGSCLWLRTLEPQDLDKLETFWERRDLVRSQGAAGTLLPGLGRLVRRSPGANRTSSRLGLVLGAFDQGGAPVGLFGLATGDQAGLGAGGSGLGRVSYSVGREAGAVFREGLRLLVDWARRRTRLNRLQIHAPRNSHSMRGLLEAMGWRPLDEDSWEIDLRRRSPSPARRAGEDAIEN